MPELGIRHFRLYLAIRIDVSPGPAAASGDEPPPAAKANWTELNKNSATINDFRGALRIVRPASQAADIRGFYMTAPSKPYKITVALLWHPGSSDGSHVCCGWRQSADGKLALIRLRRATGPGVYSSKYTNERTLSSDYINHGSAWLAMGPVLWLQFEDDGSNRVVQYGTDGLNWLALHSVTRTDFLTGDQVIFGLDNNGAASGAYAVLLHRAVG